MFPCFIVFHNRCLPDLTWGLEFLSLVCTDFVPGPAGWALPPVYWLELGVHPLVTSVFRDFISGPPISVGWCTLHRTCVVLVLLARFLATEFPASWGGLSFRTSLCFHFGRLPGFHIQVCLTVLINIYVSLDRALPSGTNSCFHLLVTVWFLGLLCELYLFLAHSGCPPLFTFLNFGVCSPSRSFPGSL